MSLSSHSRLLAAVVPVALLLGTAQCDAPADTPVDPPAAELASPAAVPGPDGTTVPGRCSQYDDLLVRYAPHGGWDVDRMSRLAWRESQCWPEVRSATSDTGLLQINDVSLGFLTTALGEPVDRTTLTDPVQNVRAAAALCEFWASHGRSCYQPWGH